MSLKDNVVSMYRSYFQSEGFYRPKIIKDFEIIGKTHKKHMIDIYFEFIQMNNLERTIIRIVENKEVTENIVWNFSNVLKDLHFFAKGIIYYNNSVSKEAVKFANTNQIALIKFDIETEIRKSAIHSLQNLLPNEDIIGDPFWTIMETTKEDGKNTGSYYIEGAILLFLSKKQADKYCEKKKNLRVFGISQNLLKILIGFREKGLSPDIALVLPEFDQTGKGILLKEPITPDMLRKMYVRKDKL